MIYLLLLGLLAVLVVQALVAPRYSGLGQIVLIGRIAFVVLTIVVVFAYNGFNVHGGSSTVDPLMAQRAIEAGGAPLVVSATCPSAVPRAAGHDFVCTVKDAAGNIGTATVQQPNANALTFDKSTIRWNGATGPLANPN